jgi:hypothetical protein
MLKHIRPLQWGLKTVLEDYPSVLTIKVLSHTDRGDLNFTFGASEIWGYATQLDPLAKHLIKALEDADLLDIQPTKLSPP